MKGHDNHGGLDDKVTVITILILIIVFTTVGIVSFT
tara:strand:+ start:88 stop:195 length:108 start_codon:yes stop_codon:yes gene_type:complete